MLLNKIEGADAAYRKYIEKTYWGGPVGTEPHPTRHYGCDMLPSGWVEITWEEFAKSKFFMYTPKAVGWIRTTIGDAKLFFMHDQNGYALINDYWGGTVKVFRFGCEHDMKSETVGNCLHRYTCQACGFSEVVDSSD
ncbi:hypothetical protein [Burkholderia gladioli]|uniref:hypothetical protein n=1 Tax=Burkholderia gladioli TaxID=28095 RepID=UPI001640DDE2|nr:hypothetical protein [Burkholderia gladioli]